MNSLAPSDLLARARRLLSGDEQREMALPALARDLHAWMPPVFGVYRGIWMARSHAAASALGSSQAITIDPGKLHEDFRSTELPEIDRAIRASLVMQDPPDHTRLRRIVAPFFTRRRLRGLAAETTERLTRRLRKAADEGGEVEFVSEISEPLILETSRRLLGWQAVPIEQLHRWSDVLARQIMRFDQKENEKTIARTAFAEFRDFLHEESDRRMKAASRRKMANDLFDALLAAEASGEITDANEFVGQCLLLLVNGMETGPTFYASLVRRLIENSKECARLRADPARIAGFVEECLRLDGSVPIKARMVMQDFPLAGVTLRRGEVVLGLLAIANRDPEVFFDPDRFDAERHPNPHLSFGRGPHRCLGSTLSRLHASALVRAFLDLARLPEIQMASRQPHQKAAIMGPAKLILHF